MQCQYLRDLLEVQGFQVHDTLVSRMDGIPDLVPLDKRGMKAEIRFQARVTCAKGCGNNTRYRVASHNPSLRPQ